VSKNKLESLKVEIMNHEIEKYDMFWLAGINSIASLSYFDKEKIFKLKYG
jgi:hypothetical protein